MNQLITPHEADSFIAHSLSPLPAESLPAEKCLGRILREPLRADRAFPPYDRITMDGIACRSRDLNMGPLKIQGVHFAGDPSPEDVRPGHCWKVMTGSSLPPGCDCIIPVEDLAFSNGFVTSNVTPVRGKFIHREGSDCPAETLLVEPGTQLNAAHLGLAATIGMSEIKVTRVPRISILTTGNELIPVSDIPQPHQLRRSNGPTLTAAIGNSGSAEWQHLPDDRLVTEQALKRAFRSTDLILLSGGISMGDKDFVRPSLESLIGPPTFHGIAQRPGKPLAFWAATSESPVIFALPGNPNSTLTTFYRYVQPALKLLSGTTLSTPITLPLSQPYQAHPKLTLLLPATLQPEGRLKINTPQNSGDFASALSATGLVEIPPGPGEVECAGFHSHSS